MFGNRIIELRKKAGLSQEDLAEKVDVSRQTVSKWENDQTVPELEYVKDLASLFNVSYEYLISGEESYRNVNDFEKIVDEINWTKAWEDKYPVLGEYRDKIDDEKYVAKFIELYEEFKNEYDFSEVDSFLIIKDILYRYYRYKTKGIK